MNSASHIHQLVQHQANIRPDAIALIDIDGSEVSWLQYEGLIEEAAALLKTYGVTANERVLIIAENSVSVPVLIMAASHLGAWAVPINARLSATELAQISQHARPAAIVFCSAVSQEAADHATTQGAQPASTGFGDLHLIGTGIEDAEPESDDVAIMLYTTGTTGDPKGVMLTHSNLLFAARASTEVRSLSTDDRVYGALPMSHVFGVATMLMASAYAGCTLQLAKRFVPADLCEALRSGVTVLPAVPQMHALVMAFVADQGLDSLGSSKLRYVSSGAAPLDPSWKRKAEAFYGLPLQNGYGMTEATAGICTTRNAIGDPDISTGLPLLGIEVTLDLSIGAEPGVGEILTSGPHIMKGYFRNPEATKNTLTEGGALRTGDLGRFDDQGRLCVVGRAKELIIHGGFNVYPPEVEAALNDHPAVVQSAVIGHLVDGDEKVLAFVQPRSPLTTEELRAFFAERLTGYKRPSRIFMVEQLPAAATGKILKHKLAKEFSELIQGS